ncbi:PAS domain S-box protein [Corallococcus sp. CA053C]|uniref:PAS domain S-box protein n=1 Tax=Corallococcus sp. CA053C TaxID=2316732 RepID=UPI000EA0DED6|nr:PAS domain S-box protein [Corallococcus sp. CA053C]RKH13829.1 PAS domain S-box protein [Corallococcus sp. CA053C]
MRDAVRQLLATPHSWTARFTVAVLAALVSTGLSVLFEPWVGGHFFVVPLSGVILSALYGGVGAGLTTTVLNVAGFVLLPYSPVAGTRPPLTEDFLRALVFAVVAALLSWVGAALRDSYRRNEQARLEAEHARLEVERTSAARGAADEARRVADARLIEVLERMSDASFALDGEWRFLYVNREGERVMGFPRESLVGRRLWDVFPAVVGSAFERYYRQAIETQQPAEFVEFYPPFQAWFEVRVFPVQDGISVFFRDVTAPRRAQQSLRESEARFRSLVLAIAQVVWTTSAAGLIEEDSASWRTFTGQTFEEMKGHGWLNALRPDDRARTASLWQEALARRGLYEVEYRMRRPDGTYTPVLARAAPVLNADGSIREWMGTNTDITARKQAEAQLRGYAERLEALHAIDRAILQAVSLQDLARTALCFLRRLIGCEEASLLIAEPGEEVSRWTVSAEAPETLRQEHPRSAGDAPPRGLPHFLELPLTLGGGRRGALRLASTREGSFDAMATQVAEEVAAQVAIAVEQGRLRRELESHAGVLEEQVAARTAELQEANAQLEAFSYSVSHDLRAPLRGIDGFLRLVEEDVAGTLSERGRGYLARVRAAAGRMGQLIDDLLKLSRLSRAPLERGDVDVSSLAASVADELRARDPTRVVEVGIAPGLRARADSRLLRVAFENLLGNAWKFTARRETGHIQVGKFDGAFFVRDDGAGFDMAYSGKLFAPFQRLHDAAEYPGTGIGLATVQRIVRRHGGRLWTEAAVDQGATFYFTLGDSP